MVSPEESSLLKRIAERRAVLAEQAERLGKELADIEAELDRVTAAEQVVMQLLAEPDGAQDGAQNTEAEQAAGTWTGVSAGPGRPVGPALLIPHRHDVADGGADGRGLPTGYRRILQVVAQAGEPVRCKRVCQAVGAGTEPKHVEAMRSKLKRLVARGWLSEAGPGRFAVNG